jgi:NAD-specific glutamate dehydrogenase
MNADPRVSDAGKAQEREAEQKAIKQGRDPVRDQAQNHAASADALEEDAARRLERGAIAIVRRPVGNIPPDFVAQLFGGAAPEDLVHYEVAEIAEIVEGTWGFLAERQPQTCRIRIGPPPSATGTRLNNVSIVEILNDDMPFLVDSVMAN